MTKSRTLNITIAGGGIGGVCISSISASLSKSSIFIGDSVTVTGKIKDYFGAGAVGIPISLVMGDIPETGTVLENGVTDSSGNYSVTHTFNDAGAFSLWIRAVNPSGCGPGVGGAYVSTGSALGLTVSANVPPPPGGPSEFVLQGNPTVSSAGVGFIYKNNTSAPITAIVYATARNQIGQTLKTATATLTNVPPGQTSAGTLALTGLPIGDYVIDFFAVTPSGIVLSATTQFTLTVYPT